MKTASEHAAECRARATDILRALEADAGEETWRAVAASARQIEHRARSQYKDHDARSMAERADAFVKRLEAEAR